MTQFALESQELINVAVIQGIFTEEEASKKEETIKKLLNSPARTSRASLDSYLVRNVLSPYVRRSIERN